MLCARLTNGWLVLALVWIAGAARAESNWPGWRGPLGNGHSTEKGFPVRWSGDSITWKSPLKGRGHSSPTIWGRRIFLTAALEGGSQRMVLCVDRNDGQLLWERIAWSGVPERSHRMNGWASASCTTDGERVYAFFGHGGGLFCYTVEGEAVWQKELGEFVSPWGTAASPLLVGNLVIQNCDADENAYIIAVDKKTGETVWKAKRDNFRGWSSPILIDVAGRKEVVLNGHAGVRAYDPSTGKELWFCEGLKGRGTPAVTPGNGLLHVLNGLRGGEIYAIRPGGNGTVSDTHVAWHVRRRSARDLPSPLLIDNYLLAMDMKGVLTAYEPQTGRQLWRDRVGGNYSSTPVSYQGLGLFISEAGETVVIEAGDKMKIVARNTIGAADDELFRASITPSDGQLFLRSDRVLYCIGDRKSALNQTTGQ